MKSGSQARFLALVAATGVAALSSASAQDAAAPPAPAVPALAAAEPLSDEAAAFRDELAGALVGVPSGESAAIEGFYAARDYAPFWTEAGSDRAAGLVAAVEDSGGQGLVPARYAPDALATALDPAGNAPAAAREVAAMRTYLRFADDLQAGMLVPSRLDDEIDIRPARPAPAALLARLDTGPIDAVLGGLEPADPEYRRLVAEKLRLERLEQSEAWGPTVPEGPTLHLGEDAPRIAEVRARLARLGYGAPSAGPAGAKFDSGLEQAVKAFQRDHGLVDDGAVGRRTLAAINAPVEQRLAQVLVNLERMRWSERDPATRHIVVNIPEFEATLYDDGGTPVWQSRVVVGEATKTRSPEFSGKMTYLVANPTWHIPNSIAIRDYLPKLQKDPMVLKRQGIDLMTRGGTIINPRLVDFTVYTPENFPFRIKQRPSDDNALGQVKFMFPNAHSVYMHDTPHRELFARDARAFSNGCIRLEQPTELAHVLLGGQVADPEAAFAGWLAAGSERNVTLDRPVPVDIVYRTVTFGDDGSVRYLDDVYGRDRTVFGALEAVGVSLAAAQG